MDHLANTEDEAMVEDIESILRGFSHERSYLIPILQEIQGKHYYLDRSALKMVARHLKISKGMPRNSLSRERW